MMLLVYFGVFGWISRKTDEMSKIWASLGVLRSGVVTLHSNVGPHQGVACSLQGVAEMRLGQAPGKPR